MGQSSSQRKAQHQDVELWELYEEDRRHSEHSRRRQDTDRAGREKRTRNTGTDGRSRTAVRGGRTGQADLDSLDIVNVRRSAAGGNSTGHSGSRRRTEDTGGSNGRMLRVYGQGTENSRTGRSSGSVEVRQGSGGRQRQRENTVRTGRTGRAGDASQIRYIQPYSGNAQRVGSSAYASYKGNARPVQSIRRRRARRRKELLGKAGVVVLMALCLVMIYLITGQIYQMVHRGNRDKTAEKSVPAVAEQVFQEDSRVGPPDMIEDLLEVNEYSRPGTPLTKINSIFVHYTANPGTSAAQNRSYFANLAQTHERSASAHLIIGYDGELIQCIPFDEQAYAVMTRNEDSISIECCYLSDDGSFTQETYDTLIHTLAWLLKEYDLSTEDILRHYDCGGKLCPLYYAENEGAWEELRQDVADYMAATE